MTRYVGIDPSLTATGIVILEPGAPPAVQLAGEKGLTNRGSLTVQADRLRQLATRIAWSVTWGDVVCIELPPPTAGRASTGESERGYLFHEVCRQLDPELNGQIMVIGVNLNTVKKVATGKGGARKSEVVDAVARRFPDIPTAGNDNLADAAVLAVIASHLAGNPMYPLPQAHLVGLNVIPGYLEMTRG